ncbi:MAG: hypothetical protein RJA70_3114, partial [Pseudomonadota bacterium]
MAAPPAHGSHEDNDTYTFPAEGVGARRSAAALPETFYTWRH